MNVSVKLLECQISRARLMGNSVDNLLSAVPHHVLNEIDIVTLTPDASPGSPYADVASGRMSAAEADHQIDALGIKQTPHSRYWMGRSLDDDEAARFDWSDDQRNLVPVAISATAEARAFAAEEAAIEYERRKIVRLFA